MSLTITSSLRNYDVEFPETPDFIDAFERRGERLYAIDHNVWRIYKDSLLAGLDRSLITVVTIHEDRKNLDSVQQLYDGLIERAAKRNMTLVSIGGGILQDITGFVASTLYRGINWIFVPTTLLAQADSCIGGKTSLNYKTFKNLLGTFYPPSHVFVHTPFLATQEDPDFYSGLGEVVKLHMIGGEGFIRKIDSSLERLTHRDPAALSGSVLDSLVIKKGFITEDEFDTGRRNMLNFGHCFGHAIESTSGFEIPHGQGVVIGMILANMVARRRGLLSADFDDYLREKLLLPTLVVATKKGHLDPAGVIKAMQKDKKRTGKDLALVMFMDGCEMVRVNDLTAGEAARVLEDAAILLKAA